MVVWSLILGFLSPAWGQLGKDLPPGTESDAVIRVYGWPKGRATSGEREIWTYASFQVVLENNRVVSVAPMSGAPVSGPTAVPPPRNNAKPPAPITPPVETPPVVVPPKATASTPSPAPSRPPDKAPRRRRSNPEEPEAPSPLWGWLRIAIGMIAVIGLGQGTALAIKHRQKLKEMVRRNPGAR